jgi:hypothetical protein
MAWISVGSSHADLRSIKLPAEWYCFGTNFRAALTGAIAALLAGSATANMGTFAVCLDPVRQTAIDYVENKVSKHLIL